MKVVRGIIVWVIVGITLGDPWSIRPAERAARREVPVPEEINLDIPEPEKPDPDRAKQRELAVHAARTPKLFHDLLLQLDLGRGPREQVAAFVILFPEVYRRAHPIDSDRARAEGLAAQAILNPRALPLSISEED